MVILVDAEDRENEGDLVIPAQMATPDAINFMAKHGRGLVCLSLTQQRAHAAAARVHGAPERGRATARPSPSPSRRAKASPTGISAHDRARTIATAIDPTKDANDIVSPGHVFPLIAREGGVLVRAGHTEASVDLARLAGLYPAAVICEIMNDDGTMARMPDLVAFAQRHGLKIGTIEDLIAYRLRNDHLVRAVAKTRGRQRAAAAPSICTSTRRRSSRSSTWRSSRATSARPAPCWCACTPSTRSRTCSASAPRRAKAARLIEKSMRTIARGGPRRDRADPRPAARSRCPSGSRRRERSDPKKADGARERRQVEIGVGSQILRDLGVSDMVLLTNSPAVASTWASRRSACASSASAGSSERHGRQVKSNPPARAQLRHPGTPAGARSSSSRRATTRPSPTSWPAGAIAELEAHRRDLRAHHRAGRARDPAGAGAGGRRGPHPAPRRQRAASTACVALGCVIRGETSHYDIVCNNANHWLMEVAVRHGIPLGNGILTVDTEAQAMARARGGARRQGRRRGARLPALSSSSCAHSRGRSSMSASRPDPGATATALQPRTRRGSPPCRRSTRWTWPAPTSTR